MATPEATILTENEQLAGINADYEQRYGFHDAENYLYKAPKGLSRKIVEKISEFKSEPRWMRVFRLKALDHFFARKQPTWGSPMLAELDYDNIRYFVRASDTPSRSWDDVPEDVKRTFDRLGIPEAERKFLSGVGAQYESEVVYHQIHEDLEKQGVIFTDMDTALREHEDIVRQYFATVIPPNDNKLAALNSAVWSGGSFVYVPEGVHIDMPLQAYFRINTENMGQFERTLIIAEPGSFVHYVEGCHLAGSMVRVHDGEKPIEEIEAGDDVLTHRGRFRRVREPMRRRHSGPIYHIRFQGEGYRSLAVTPGHPFLVAPRRHEREHNKVLEPQWLTAQELRKGDYLAVPAKIDAETRPQLLGDPELSVGRGRHAAVLERIPVAVDDKLSRVMEPYPGYLWMPISSIETVHAECEVFNMSVEDDESYVCEGVVSHNCTAPTYSSDSLHSAVVELIALPGARIRYTTVQNWSTNVYNLVTKRAVAYADATVEWVDCNLGSKLTMKYPSIYLLGERAHGEVLSIAFAGAGQHQDAGAKIIHAAPNTTSNIFAKSISKDGGRGSYRGLLEIAKGAHGSRSKVVCDALLLDEHSRSDTYPTIRIGDDDVNVGHEATVSKVGDDQLFYLMSHGIREDEASKLIVNGFVEPIIKELPMEYAVEMNRLIELQMEGSIG